MNYSSLFLSNESIENVFKSKEQKTIGRGFDSLVNLKTKKDIEDKCGKCDYKTSIISYMYKHNRIKHSDIKHKCTECNYTHTFPTKVKTHHKQVHLGFPRSQNKLKCRKNICKDAGKSDCEELQHFLIYCVQCDYSTNRNDHLRTHTKRVHEGLLESFHCDQCNFSTSRNDVLKIHTNKVHEGLVESFPCGECNYSTSLKSSLKKHISAKHIEEAMQGRYTDVAMCDHKGCSYKTLFIRQLRTHIDTKHKGIIRFRCEFMNCTFGTNQRRVLRIHTMSHTGIVRFRCEFMNCTFGTNRGNVLKRHTIKHMSVEQFKCDHLDCAFETYDQSSLKAHTMKHKGEQAPKCDSCDQTFSGDGKINGTSNRNTRRNKRRAPSVICVIRHFQGKVANTATSKTSMRDFGGSNVIIPIVSIVQNTNTHSKHIH